MDRFFSILTVALGILVVMGLGYGAVVALTDTMAGKDKELPTVERALRQIGLEQADWQTIVVAASQETPVPPAQVWQTWAKLEDWNQWSPLHTSTAWTNGTDWQVGAQFEQGLDLGPAGKMVSHETIREVTPGESVLWSKDENGVASAHIWMFEALPDGGTRITNVEVFHGTLMGLLKPLLASDWQKKFEESVNHLVARAGQPK